MGGVARSDQPTFVAEDSLLISISRDAHERFRLPECWLTAWRPGSMPLVMAATEPVLREGTGAISDHIAMSKREIGVGVVAQGWLCRNSW
jgi:hypothetical protein